MNENIIKQINKEILIFLGLSVVNIIFGAIALAMGIVFIVTNLLYLIESESYLNISLIYIFIGFGLAGIGFWWLLTSASLMDFITDIQLKYFKKKEGHTTEKITSLIVNMISYYRENSNKIKRMIFICRIGGILIILNGIVSSIDLYLKLNSSIQLTNHLMQISAIILMFAWGILSLLLPRFISKFASLWESRIKKSEEVEEIIKKQMESQ